MNDLMAVGFPVVSSISPVAIEWMTFSKGPAAGIRIYGIVADVYDVRQLIRIKSVSVFFSRELNFLF